MTKRYKMISATLPEWAWLDGADHEETGNRLEGRNVIYHVRSATVIEMFENGMFKPNPGVVCKTFVYRNELTGEKETYIAVIHYSAAGADELMQRDILDAAIEWFCRWIRWEDGNVSSDMTSQLN